MKEGKDSKELQDHTETFWKYHISQANHSGLSKKAYCKEKGLDSSHFYYWNKKIVNPSKKRRVFGVCE